jgi:hypothetical protein
MSEAGKPATRAEVEAAPISDGKLFMDFCVVFAY